LTAEEKKIVAHYSSCGLGPQRPADTDCVTRVQEHPLTAGSLALGVMFRVAGVLVELASEYVKYAAAARLKELQYCPDPGPGTPAVRSRRRPAPELSHPEEIAR
jgi:hypothetical protein